MRNRQAKQSVVGVVYNLRRHHFVRPVGTSSAVAE
jgi:hypothetical protein